MLEQPLDLSWSHWPLRQRPRQLILLLAITLFAASLVWFWLGVGWTANTLLLAFVFSLRNLLFPRNVLVADDGVSISHPLTGARRWSWREVEALESQPDGWRLRLAGKAPVLLPDPPPELVLRLREWGDWRGRAGDEDL
jgi:hypothetical protein